MTDIITELPRSFTDGEIDQAFMKELVNGFEIEKRTEHERVAIIEGSTTNKGQDTSYIG